MTSAALSRDATAIPIVSDVIIIGEAVVGGTLSGSYRYLNESENPEGASIHEWTVDGAIESTTMQLSVVDAYLDKEIVFTVTPVAASGEFGRPSSSDAKVATTGFQNITDEENINSFMKQHGNFSFYTPEPADRIFVSTGGAFSLIDNKSQNVYVQGQDDYGAVVPESLRIYLKNNPATVMYSTERDFAALVPLGSTTQMLAWGSNMPVVQDVSKMRGIRSVYANSSAFAYIYEKLSSDNKWIGALGDAAAGGTVPDAIHLKLINDPPRAIYATYTAFAVLTRSGKVHAWGDSASGGAISADAQAILDRMTVKRIVSNMSAFCAIDEAGTIVVWGNAEEGGVIPADRLETILDQGGVKSVIAAQAAFCAITKGRAKAVSWGVADEGGDMSNGAAELAARGNIVLCRAATWAFCMVNAVGQADAWGTANSGGTIPASHTVDSASEQPVDIGEVMNAVGVKRNIRQVFVEKMRSAGIDLSSAKAIRESGRRLSEGLDRILPNIIIEDGKVSIHANDSSFLLIAQDEAGFANQVLVWGQANGGGEMPDATRQALMASVITSVYCTNGAYGVIANQGRVEGVVTVWGATLDQQDAGEIPEEPPEIKAKLSGGIVEIYSIKRRPPERPTPVRVDPSFAARHKDGTYVLWGGNVDNQVFDPKDHESHVTTMRRPRQSLSPGSHAYT